MLSSLYKIILDLATPILHHNLKRRAANGKEITLRLGERFGFATLPRPEGKLIWCHAASVGEAVSLLILIKRLLERSPDIHVLVTTGTVNSEKLLAQRLPERTLHQFLPLDRRLWTDRFLDYWRPDLVLWVESEIWPNMLKSISARAIPAALVNARISVRSAKRWHLIQKTFSQLLNNFSIRLAQSDSDAARLQSLGVNHVQSVGNLKFAADPSPVDSGLREKIIAAIGKRPFWLAASTHPGEEKLALDLHQNLLTVFPDLLTIIVPRHPERRTEIMGMIEDRGLSFAQRSLGQFPNDKHIFLIDTLGELGTLYSLTGIAFIGGSFRQGGHNPVEAAQLHTALIYGPDMRNNAGIAEVFEQAQGAIRLTDPESLTEAVRRLLQNPQQQRQMADIASSIADSHRKIVDRVMEALEPAFVMAKIF